MPRHLISDAQCVPPNPTHVICLIDLIDFSMHNLNQLNHVVCKLLTNSSSNTSAVTQVMMVAMHLQTHDSKCIISERMCDSVPDIALGARARF